MARMTNPALVASIVALAVNYPPASMRLQLAQALATLLDRERPTLEGREVKLTEAERQAIAVAMGPPNARRARRLVLSVAAEYNVTREYVQRLTREYWERRGYPAKVSRLTDAQRAEIVTSMGPPRIGARPRGLCATVAARYGCSESTIAKIVHAHWSARQPALPGERLGGQYEIGA